MKKGLLFVLALFFVALTVDAKPSEMNHKKMGYTKQLQPIVFMENGIKFSVLPNGEFRFSKLDFNRIQSHRYARFERNRGVRVVRDYSGRIIKVGNVPVFYKRNGKIAQIGTVQLKYKHGKLKRIGDMHIVYHPHGNVKYIGKVKNRNYWNIYNRSVVIR